MTTQRHTPYRKNDVDTNMKPFGIKPTLQKLNKNYFTGVLLGRFSF